ncbi:MAG: hypothetical protein BGO87_12380 [Flavobacteriia bacterium 40-80]|nr:MAG: hypothetical protein BGO87_12380 [Flavobacteriia bacterium 40-80]
MVYKGGTLTVPTTMTDKQHIRQLLDNYIRGQYTRQQLDELLRHSTQTEDEHTVGELIEQYLAELDTEDLSQTDRLSKLLNRTDRKIREAIPLPDPVTDIPSGKRRGFPGRWMAVAALLITALSFSLYMLLYNAPVQTIRITADGTVAQQVDLPDGSQVWLNAGATLTYPEKFDTDTRAITLSDGQAYFDIARDEKRPFTVDAGALSVQVLGTAFEITSYNNMEHASVAVQRGKVNVSPGHMVSTPGTILTANQKATVNTRTGTVETTDINTDDIAGWKDNRLVFSSDDFATVIEAIQRKYNVTIDLKKSALLQEKITLRLDDQPVRTALEILSISSNFKYELANDSTIIIK